MMVKWGNFYIECGTCGMRRHTGTDRNAEMIKDAHEFNHPGHVCLILDENDYIPETTGEP